MKKVIIYMFLFAFNLVANADGNKIKLDYSYPVDADNVPSLGNIGLSAIANGWVYTPYYFNTSDIDSIVYSCYDYDGVLYDNPVLQCIWVKGQKAAFIIENITDIEYISSDPIDIEPENPDNPDDPSQSTVEAVDLGLSVKWAACNIGASKPEEFGDYYAWGETETKASFNTDNYKWYDGASYIKYNKDNKELEADDDVAHIKWGGDWRLPTADELKELNDKCTWTWTTLNEVNGYEVKGPNGNSIFLPDTGFMYETERVDGTMYPSSTHSINDGNAECILFYSTLHNVSNSLYVEFGYTVRAVCK